MRAEPVAQPATLREEIVGFVIASESVGKNEVEAPTKESGSLTQNYSASPGWSPPGKDDSL